MVRIAGASKKPGRSEKKKKGEEGEEILRLLDAVRYRTMEGTGGKKSLGENPVR